MSQAKIIIFKFVLFFVIFKSSCSHVWTSMSQKISHDRDLSQFYSLVQNNRVAKAALLHKEVTIFAPKNEALDNYEGKFTEDLVLYHIIGVARTLDNLNTGHLGPFLEEYPPLWVTHETNDIFINNAKIIKNISDFVLRTRSGVYGRIQVLHILDEVLSPMALTSTAPSAYDYLSQQSLWQTIPFTTNFFYKKIIENRKSNLYKNTNENTFFIPVDQYMDRNTISAINKDIIDVNIIANRVIFVRGAIEGFSYVTRGTDRYAFNTIEFVKIGAELYVKTASISKTTNQKISEKIIQIVWANIPCKNGVIHLVREVLGIYQKKLTKFPYLSVLNKIQTDPNLNITSYLIEKTGLYELLELETCNFTLFLPTDTAWKQFAADNNVAIADLNKPTFLERAKTIMERHVVGKDIYSLQRLLDASQNLRHSQVVLDVICSDQIMVKVIERDGKYFIHWGTSTIRILRHDYECSNGLIHIIDKPFVYKSEMKDLKPKPVVDNFLHNVWSMVKHSVV